MKWADHTMKWADCDCCWPQKPFIRKAVGWKHLGVAKQNTDVSPFWYVDVGGWPRGHHKTWEKARDAALKYLKGNPYDE